ncbi:MAG TPA: DUF72 domain-containing protein [Thermoanaerobaculia bacterium]|nr:DUF72 domain-containing protein [Thermoanaerobaculia bacterium]
MIRIGTQGWNYDAWVGPFYPSGTRAPEFLSFYARAFDTVEVDSTFYAIPDPKSVRGWASRVPAGFTFALKLPKEITHERRLRNADGVLHEFLEGVRQLGEKLGPILMQMGPDFEPSELPALIEFLPLLPRDLQFAIEFRQRGWIDDGVLELLAEHNIAVALSDARWIPRKTMLSLAAKPTADFAYVRWMGPNRDIVDYSHIQFDRTRELEAWSEVLAPLGQKVKTVWAYANNHFAGHSPETARQIMRLLGQKPVLPEDLRVQRTLF